MGTFRRAGLAPGIYDEIITRAVEDQLERLDPARFDVERRAVDRSADVTSPLVSLLRGALDLALDELGGESARTLALAGDVLSALAKHAPRAFKDGEVQVRPERLVSIISRPGAAPGRPRGSLHASSLIVNAEGESLLDH